MNITDLKKEQIILVGLGSENYALIDYLKTKNFRRPLTIISFSSRLESEKIYPKLKKWKNITWIKGQPNFKQLKKYSLIIKSPGAFFSPSLRQQLKKNNIKIISPIQLFLDFCPSKNIIGVTGTKGKGTTTSLINAILHQAKKRVWLGGNIGVAPFTFIKKIKKTDWVILELSSFQLEDITTSPHIAVMTNFSKEHLIPADNNNPNYHPSLAHYWQAKFNLIRFQNKNDVAIINQKLKTNIGKKINSKKIFFTSSNVPTTLPGNHNKENIAAAIAVAQTINIPEKIIKQAVAVFKGLPYRLQKVAEKNGLEYYNDSFATTPEATITALKAFNEPVILIAGGADKGSDFTALAKTIKQKVKFLVLFKGRALTKIQKSLKENGYPTNNIKIADTMKKAIEQAQSAGEKGNIILLSPACASFGLFKNYKDRGDQFNNLLRS